ncbi:MAG: N-methyl-L-tryptophan oxidase [Chthoniobacterales bacterium]
MLSPRSIAGHDDDPTRGFAIHENDHGATQQPAEVLSPTMTYDVCVVGLGGIGSAILAHCAARGARVIGLEQFARDHDLGSSSGRTRMIRTAYFEEPAYVPLVRRSYQLWHDLERTSGESLLTMTGVLTVGREDSEIIVGTRRAAREHGLPIYSLDRREVKARYPVLRMQPDEVAIFDNDAGVLKPERAIARHLEAAEKHGATTRFNIATTRWQAKRDRFDVFLHDGSNISASRLILAMGPWIQETLRELGVTIRVQRNVQAWFAPEIDDYASPKFPAFLVERDGLPAPLYGFPDFGDGVKAAFHGAGELTTAEEVKREIDEAQDVAPIARAMDDWMPQAAGRLLSAKACMYSLTPDEHFVVDRHPEHERLILCGGFSGHGFKFAPVIGEIATDLALDGGTSHNIDFLSLRRFRGGKP